MTDRRVLFALAVGTLVLSGGWSSASAQNQPTPEPGRTARPDRDGQQVDLRPRFVNGRLSRYEMTIVSDNRVRSDEQGISQDQTLTQTIDLSIKTTGADDDGATLEIVYERIRATLETGDFKAVFDSRAYAPTPAGQKPAQPKPHRAKNPGTPRPAAKSSDPEMDDLLGQILRPMVGTRLTMRADKDGNIKSVSGGEALSGAGLAAGLAAMLGGSGIGGGAPGVGAGGASGPMNWVVNSPGQRSLVRLGETWTNRDALSGTPIGGFTMVTRHTCNSVTESRGGRTANLSFTGRADQESLGTPSATGFALKESSYNGNYAWDLSRGELKDMTSTLRTIVEGKLTNFTTRMTAETRMSVRRLD
ncbi:MAG: hypothetical protein ACK4WH_05325 [Phycisphaerales bacterium]